MPNWSVYPPQEPEKGARALAEQIERDGGTVLAVYQEPIGGHWQDGPMGVVENSKLTVVGAGSVGASLAYAALIRGSASEVALYDIAAEKVEAEVLDLAHGTQFTDARVTGGSDLAVAEVEPDHCALGVVHRSCSCALVRKSVPTRPRRIRPRGLARRRAGAIM